MRLTLRQLQIFVAVCRAGSTAGAADQIALSQSATSAALGELEGVLEAKLFDRVGKRLVLNDNGRVLLPQAMQMLDAATTIEKQFTEPGDTGGPGLQIGASTTIGNYLLPSILGGYVAPGTDAYARVLIANTSDVARAVANFEVDVGLIEGPCHEPDLQVEPWLQDELIIVCAVNHPILGNKRSDRISVKALREAGWLLREPGSGTREAVEHALVPHLHYLRIAGEFSNAEAIKRAAVAGARHCLPLAIRGGRPACARPAGRNQDDASRPAAAFLSDPQPAQDPVGTADGLSPVLPRMDGVISTAGPEGQGPPVLLLVFIFLLLPWYAALALHLRLKKLASECRNA